MMRYQIPDAQWAAAQVQGLPKRWESRLLKRWESVRGQFGPDHWIDSVRVARDANIELRETAGSLKAVRTGLDASDSDICAAADTLAARIGELAQIHKDEKSLYDALCRLAQAQGIKPPQVDYCHDIPPALARFADPQWWRRQLRKVHAKHVEGAAIVLGYVNRSRDKYVSNESVLRRAQQNKRNAEALEATTATNEDGDTFTLAELAAKGPANKAIRRAELMTRIAGFERIAKDLGHQGVFATVTCPSFMHKFTIAKNKAVVENRHYKGVLPDAAQAHLGKVWARTRAKLKRAGISVYGFRIAEPNHDGTPHWHMLFFVEPGRVEEFRTILRHYALQTAPDEKGADVHRVDFKLIDGRGAAGYIAKYVAKNLDGFALQTDLCGGVEMVEKGATTAHRVEAWASTWRIRQFQQIGGPPVGVWRELRRVEAVPANAPAALRDAHAAVNSAKWLNRDSETPHDLEEQDAAGAAWDKYVKAQGGPHCGRTYPVRVTMIDQDGENKYGEPKPQKPVGVEHPPTKELVSRGYKLVAEITIEWFVASVRRTWTITRAAGKFLAETAQRFGPWTCVNNCTQVIKKIAGDEAETAREVQKAERAEAEFNSKFAGVFPVNPWPQGYAANYRKMQYESQHN